jgi:succinate dehydrogenase/fumarate reductase cytochrome b subunit
MHICVTSLRAWDIYLWAGEDALLAKPIFRIGEYLVFAAFAYHACNGLRLVLVELGFAVGKPIEPIYPYRTSLNVQRPLFVVMMLVAAGFLALGTVEFIGYFAE